MLQRVVPAHSGPVPRGKVPGADAAATGVVSTACSRPGCQRTLGQGKGSCPPAEPGLVPGQRLPAHKQGHGDVLEGRDHISPRNTGTAGDIHAILDNYGTHNHPKVRAWLTNPQRFQLHFIPTSSSWLNLVERWFGEITRKRIRRGSFNSIHELIQAIDDYIKINNENPKPFVWTKKVDAILGKISRCKPVAGTLH